MSLIEKGAELGLTLLDGLFKDEQPKHVVPNPYDWMFGDDEKPVKKHKKVKSNKKDSSVNVDVRESHDVNITIEVHHHYHND